VLVRVLGSAAGGGYPQWNCNCNVCAAARSGDGRALSRSQSSIAVRGEGGRWWLVNASPDLRQQLAELPSEHGDGLRLTPFDGVVLTDAEIDHTAGLLLLRESSVPLTVYSTDPVRQALSEHYPVLTMLERYCGVRWESLEGDGPISLDAALEVEVFPTGGDPPLYVGDALPELRAIGLTIRDRATAGVLTYAPALEALDDAILARFDESDYVFVDGTFWTRDELVALGLAERDAYAMGHQPLLGPDGTLERLRHLSAKTILVHVNNTNPILLEDSAERSLVVADGVEVARDGMEVRL